MRSARIPDNVGFFLNSPFVSNRTMSSAVTPSRTGFMFMVPEAFTCTTLLVRQGTLTGTPGVMRIGLQGAAADGKNDNTWLATVSGGAGTAYVDYSSWSSGNNAKFISVTLPTGGVSLTRGQVIYVVFQCQSGTWDATNNVSMTYEWSSPQKEHKNYTKTFETSKQNISKPAPFILRSSTTSYGYPVESAATATGINETSTPDEIGMAFTIPSAYTVSLTVRGIVFWMASNTNQSAKVILYQGTTLLQDVTYDFDLSIGDYGPHEIYFDETTLSTLSPNTEYVVSIQPIGTATTQGIAYLVLPADSDATAFTDWNPKFYSCTNAGSWTHTTGRIPQVQLIVDTITGSSGSGGLIVHPGMTGGMRG